LISTLVDKTTNIFDDNFLHLSIDQNNLERLKNESFRNALFYASLKQDVIDNSHYLYLLITSNFYSKYNFISYQSPEDLEKLLIGYINFKFSNSVRPSNSISNLDKLLLQLGSSNFNSSMEVDHIFPLNRIKISNYLDQYLQLNHIGNLCYLSKKNNQKKSNKLPSEYVNKLIENQEYDLLYEFKTQIYWEENSIRKFIFEINKTKEFKVFLEIRSSILISKVLNSL